jgi:hypothetical protein
MEMRQYVTESLAFLLAQNMDRGIPEYQCNDFLSSIFNQSIFKFQVKQLSEKFLLQNPHGLYSMKRYKFMVEWVL